ncbi:hypothetical protein F5J12DRAFT_788000 [Pisolithus orientalis]|uniref:uncharacterized protein n=1 Tax=Pisolithus orientalis TaxID=936130 RepID=UPI002224B665|nr:uncharacterized protein F5J12DRAFT_788000 [Pisolithus orientalis]KAI5983004.1 hypothetical protein F5J12DRAFT_788000 [Pisolithus orientalis]
MHAKGDKGHQCLGGTQKNFRERETSWWMNQLTTSNHAYYKQQMACWEWNDRNLSAMGCMLQDHLHQYGSKPMKQRCQQPLNVMMGHRRRKGTKFTTYFMVPYVATLLITDDYSPITVVKAHKTMVASSDVGSLIHPTNDDDTELEEIFHRNIVAFRLKQLELLTCEATSDTWDAAQALLELQGQMQKASPTLSSCPRPRLRVKLLVTDDDSNQAANKLHSEQTTMVMLSSKSQSTVLPVATACVQQHTPNASIGQTAGLVTSEHAKLTYLDTFKTVYALSSELNATLHLLDFYAPSYVYC